MTAPHRMVIELTTNQLKQSARGEPIERIRLSDIEDHHREDSLSAAADEVYLLHQGCRVCLKYIGKNGRRGADV